MDFQYDFCLTDGPLYVEGAEKALWNISDLLRRNVVDNVIFTADWHPVNHCSFIQAGGQWPRHCVQYSRGAAIHDLLLRTCAYIDIPYQVFVKGVHPGMEEYGAFDSIDVNGGTLFGRAGWVTINTELPIVVCGLAGDYCVKETHKNLGQLNPYLFMAGIASIDGGISINNYKKENNVKSCCLLGSDHIQFVP